MLPYTPEVYFSLLEQYNRSIWPTQLIAYVLGFLALWLIVQPRGSSGRLVSAILAVFWLWTAIAYHGLYFSSINFWALGFAVLFLVQTILFAWSGIVRGHLEFRASKDVAGQAGVYFMMFALAIYPALSWLAGHVYPRAPAFGVTPCPLVLFTLGALLTCSPRVPWTASIIPILWSLIGGSAAWFLGITEDLSLWLAAAIFVVLALKP